MAVMVSTPLYAGPAELLLRQVKDEELDLWELSLADFISSYLAEIKDQEELNLDEATELLVIAALLVELKSHRLLPEEVVEEIEEFPEGVFDLLIARMMECRTYRAVSHTFEQMALEARRSYPRLAGPDERYLELMPDLLKNLTLEDLQKAYIKATSVAEEPELGLSHFSPITRTLPETIDALAQVLGGRGSATFKELTESEDRIGVVFCFLAVLELYKIGMVDIYQENTFGRIRIEWVAP